MAAAVTREILEGAGAASFCKTSGATGLHVYVPLDAQYEYLQVQQFAKIVNMLVNYRLPDTTSIERTPCKRYHKVYLDYLQNRRGQTMVAPYSVRPRRGAPVCAPLQWDEVNEELDPMRFTMKTMMKRVGQTGDLWKGVLGPGADLHACLVLLEKMFAAV